MRQRPEAAERGGRDTIVEVGELGRSNCTTSCPTTRQTNHFKRTTGRCCYHGLLLELRVLVVLEFVPPEEGLDVELRERRLVVMIV